MECFAKEKGEDEDKVDLTAGLVAEKLDLEKMSLVYLERCIMEALRLDPPINLTTIHETVGNVKLQNGHIVPKGTRFAFNLVAIHRDID